MCALCCYGSGGGGGVREDSCFDISQWLDEGDIRSCQTALPSPPRHVRTRVSATVPFPEELQESELAAQHGLPAQDAQAGMARDADGKLKPTKEGPLSARFKYKLQDPAHVRGLARFDQRLPSLGMGSCKLLLSEAALKRGQKATKMVSLAGPTTWTLSAPRGVAKKRRIATATVRSNVCMMDELGDITFGTVAYPAWVRA